jgi:hypothetical protein
MAEKPEDSPKVVYLVRKGPLATAAERRPSNFKSLPPQEQWDIDKSLGILDWSGSPND